jgi:hypothetical protein
MQSSQPLQRKESNVSDSHLSSEDEAPTRKTKNQLYKQMIGEQKAQQ